MHNKYIRLIEDTIQFRKDGSVAHHPLDGPYNKGKGAGLLTFQPRQISNYDLFNDVRVFNVLIDGNNVIDDDDRDSWADPIRSEILRRLQKNNWRWCISAACDAPSLLTHDRSTSQNEYWLEQYIISNHVPYAIIQSDTIYGTVMNRLFFEVEQQEMENLIINCFRCAHPGHTIQGYLLPPTGIDRVKSWSLLPHDEATFRYVVDTCSIIFYTFPAEHNNFAFITNKYDYVKVEHMLKIRSLERWAKQIIDREVDQ
ncbi:MAG: hypothetical protein NC238_13545 [Dehalobacter sp.]|nr:hypothetical protein [Dehalobacter sp.]